MAKLVPAAKVDDATGISAVAHGITKGEHLAGVILQKWKGKTDVKSAIEAASDIGLLVSAGFLKASRGLRMVDMHMGFNKYAPIHRSTIVGAFDNSCDATVTFADILQPAQANDNNALPVIDPRDWQGKPVPDREWFVPGLIPQRTVTLKSGDGGSGKTQTTLQLLAASALGEQWFGRDVGVGPCLLYTAEDEADELHRRLAKIVERAGKSLSDLDGIRLIPMAGLDAILAEPDNKGRLLETVLFPKLKDEIQRLKPSMVAIDPSADVFGGDEINRAQVRKFVSMLRALAIECDCAVLLLSHPSLTGLNTGTGTSGSTAWSNSVRSRLYLQVVKDDPNRRVLKVVKANYGPTGEEIKLCWDDGIYVVDTGTDPVIEKVVNKSADDIFMSVFLKLTGQGQALGPNVGPSYAPKKIAGHPDAKGFDKRKLSEAMQRLLDSGILKIEATGPPSRRYTYLVATSN